MVRGLPSPVTGCGVPCGDLGMDGVDAVDAMDGDGRNGRRWTQWTEMDAGDGDGRDGIARNAEIAKETKMKPECPAVLWLIPKEK